MKYLHWKEKKLESLSEPSATNLTEMYNQGFVFGRLDKGVMQQTRSCRIDLSKFEPSSENRRILKKTDGLEIDGITLPLREEYDWSIGKLAKDFYDTKFGNGTMSANKIKELLTEEKKSNFNTLLVFSINEAIVGYAICLVTTSFMHYSYPFYDLVQAPKDTGLGMMIRAIHYAKLAGMKYIYLGSLQRPTDTYKLQFDGLEWFDGGPEGTDKWSTDIVKLKEILK